jgi:hypothetical protein
MITAGLNDMFVTLLAAEAAAGGLRVGESSLVVNAGKVEVKASGDAGEGEEPNDPTNVDTRSEVTIEAPSNSGSGATGASGNQPGGDASAPGQVATQIAMMLEDFLKYNSGDLDALAAGCVTALDRLPDDPRNNSAFATLCKDLLQGIVETAKARAKARAQQPAEGAPPTPN